MDDYPEIGHCCQLPYHIHGPVCMPAGHGIFKGVKNRTDALFPAYPRSRDRFQHAALPVRHTPVRLAPERDLGEIDGLGADIGRADYTIADLHCEFLVKSLSQVKREKTELKIKAYLAQSRKDAKKSE
ncbi:MAG: hypothetical protein A2010_04815 [Nitrospirae bacterium GWD2_57_9]|nr:MAG: hypothetical protein A2010_04815 [Nitrospirae bacterium GWD2_57_9]